MDLSNITTHLTVENIQQFLQQYRALGPFPGILLPLAESFFPPLPLILFVVGNGAAYGFLYGSLLSLIGTCTGSVIVYWIFRKLSDRRFGRWIKKNRKIRSTLYWLEQHGFGPLFLLFCFPFTPSSLVNVASGLSGLNFRSFLLAVLLGKTIMICFVSYIGDSWLDLFYNPLKFLVIAGVVLILWLIGKQVEKRVAEGKTSRSKE